MSINTDVTLRRLTHELKEWSDNHEMINDFFGYGQFLQLFMEGKRDYPAMVVNVTSAASDKWYINYNFEVMILQYVNDEQDNRERAMSDCRQILNDLQETVSYSNRWQSFSRLDGTFNVTPAIQKGADKAYGWIGTFTLKVKKRHGICNLQSLMPEYDFETGTIISPTCAPVSIYRDDVFEENVESGGRFDYSTACSDATVTVNDEAFNTVASGGTLDVPVQYANGTPTGTNIGGIITIDNPIVCADATVNLNGVFNQTVASGGTADVIVGNSEITVNGVAFDSLVPEEALDVPVEYENGSPIGTITAGVVVVPNPVISNNSASLFKTGANVSYQAQDDGELQFGNGVDFFTLNANNPFGNLNRFTDSLGTQIYANGIVIDWSTWNVGGATVRAYYNTLNAADTLTNQLDNQPYTQASFTGWYVCNYIELTNIFNLSITRDYLNYAPFNHSIGASTTRIWVSTRDSASVGIYYGGLSITVGNHSGSYQALLTREFTLTELGL